MARYTYTQLPTPRSIRLLCLAPSHSHFEPLSGSFVVSSAEETPEFEAISYVWGSPVSQQAFKSKGSVMSPSRLGLHPHSGGSVDVTMLDCFGLMGYASILIDPASNAAET